MFDQTILTLITQTPVLAALIWFLIHHTKQTDRRFELQGQQFSNALHEIVEKIGERLERVEDKLESKGIINEKTADGSYTSSVNCCQKPEN